MSDLHYATDNTNFEYATDHDRDSPSNADSTDATLMTDAVSIPFVGRWNRLVSQTNWEKGKIIFEWRQAQMEAKASPNSYRDELWAIAVGGITPQHVGRLRRVYERFADTHHTYEGLFWSHFLAALDWDDAEMWLEGAARSSMSVSEMRRTRWQALGSDPKQIPRDQDVVASSLDEDFVSPPEQSDPTSSSKQRSAASGPLDEGPDFGDPQASSSYDAVASSAESQLGRQPSGANSNEHSPFANLPPMPPDLAEALELFKLAIIRHRAAGWQELSQQDALGVLDSLRSLILADGEFA